MILIVQCAGVLFLLLRAVLQTDEPAYKWILPAGAVMLAVAVWIDVELLVYVAIGVLSVGFWLDYRWRSSNVPPGRLFL